MSDADDGQRPEEAEPRRVKRFGFSRLGGLILALNLLSLLILFGGIFSLILVGVPFLLLGIFICSVVGIWFGIRCIVGLMYLSRGEAYPRPMNWLI